MSKGEWVGEDCIFSKTNTLNYTVRAKTAVSVIQIRIKDFKKVMNLDYVAFLQKISF